MLDDDTKLKYLLHIALGLKFMHSIGMYHRDLKLDNFLYVPATDSIVIIDFGLAVMGKAEDTSSEQVGTKMFSSPQ
jgi:serine/threonine protein kinase